MSSSRTPLPPLLHVADLQKSRRFFVHALGCMPVCSRDGRVELDFFGHPLTLVAAGHAASDDRSRITFVLGVDDWCTTSERLREHRVDVVVETSRRFSVVPGEQCAMRLHDPEGNVLELRGFATEADRLAA